MSIYICRCKKDVIGFKFGVVYEILYINPWKATLINSEGCESVMDFETYEENFDFIGETNESN